MREFAFNYSTEIGGSDYTLVKFRYNRLQDRLIEESLNNFSRKNVINATTSLSSYLAIFCVSHYMLYKPKPREELINSKKQIPSEPENCSSSSQEIHCHL